MDGDGDVDLVATSRNDDTVRWFENSGTYPPTFTSQVVARGMDFVHYIDVGDVDDDGDVDVVSASANMGVIAVHVNDGRRPPSFSMHNVSVNFGETRFACFADVNSDGWLDVVATSKTPTGVLVWYANQSNRTRVAFAPPRYPCFIGQ
jgi:hypothetical protein